MTPDPAATPATGRPAVPLWNIANALTMVRIVLVPVFVVLFLQDTDTARLWAAVVFAVAAATDKLDGYLARSRGLVTDFGKLADPVADKALVIAALLVLSAAGLLWWWVTVVIIVRELAITALRSYLRRRGYVMAASRGGKLKTSLQVLFILLLLVPWSGFVPSGVADAISAVALVVVLLALAVTVLTAADYAAKAARIVRAQQADGAGPRRGPGGRAR
ncbi:CDP-diacylglycerol--glycerol-3-phosphate 3-phosphatidyltransferase [Georgenia sp. TF02-10]|uniref:CDP-diacylglycerol--glycerol-3-phosphate 3-phosphatidyltransferase n=1 Tax=Georgenia sp. TF02-10 TaxID=2917725 RepID=UPI001FA7E347|nr:CDP-diacylglycerol--glycerol-3-phosphate 3-phosphatidyltransferase [Georgenia sp. TF02-10]UNX55933.1 CDP-diacylglycerol--glycerol-3-phosphate 3-phosphatidyltransferase [Georgenia sp. TF02-10]